MWRKPMAARSWTARLGRTEPSFETLTVPARADPRGGYRARTWVPLDWIDIGVAELGRPAGAVGAALWSAVDR
jgi:hypothetical protein